MNQNIYLIGANGIIGSFLRKNLDSKIFPFSSNPPSKSKIEKLDCLNKNDVYRFVDVISPKPVIIFLVGLAHKKGKNSDEKQFYGLNYNTLKNLVNTMVDKGKSPSKVIFASSISVYGERLGRDLYDEFTSVMPKSPYAKSKYESEKFLLEKLPNKSWILRFAPVYSDKFLLNLDRRTKLFNFFYKVGDGKNKLSLCNIKNIKNVVENIFDNKVPPGIYNISDKSAYTYNQVLCLKNAKKIIKVPRFILKVTLFLGKVLKSHFLFENSIKLLSNNIYSSKKLLQFSEIPYELND